VSAQIGPTAQESAGVSANVRPTPRQNAGVERRVDLVFEGGGVKGVALAGAYLELSERGYTPECVAGTSAGAITAALVAVGYSGAELEDIVLGQMHFPSFEDQTFLDRLGPPGEFAEFIARGGIHSGDFFLSWIRKLLAAKGKTKFGDLRSPSGEGGNRAYALQVITSDLTDRSMLVLPRDAGNLGIDPDELEIAQAVRMSMSIPVFFKPVAQKHPVTGVEHVIVDGGILSNYPIWLFDAPGSAPPRFPTFGMMLVAPGQDAPVLPTAAPGDELADVRSRIEFLKLIVETMADAHDRFYVEQANYARTIPIPTLGVRTTQFDITPEKTRELFESGRTAAKKFLSTWDFEAYKATFRSEKPPPGRRESVT
jgi:NTE family protein